MTLIEQLTALGYRVDKAVNSRKMYAKTIYKGTNAIFTGTAQDVWQWLRNTGQIKSSNEGKVINLVKVKEQKQWESFLQYCKKESIPLF